MRISAVMAGLGLAAGAAGAPAYAQQPWWLRAEAGVQSDNQPRTATFAAVEYMRGITTGTFLAGGARLEHADTGAEPTALTPAVSFATSTGRLGIELRGGAVLGAGSGAEPVFAAAARLGAGAVATVRASAERARYATTLASLDTLLLRNRYELAIDRSADARWAFAAVGAREDFGDDNPVHTLYAWGLAPVSASERHRLRAGYAASWQDAALSRWTPDDARRGVARGRNPADTIPGRYAPYYSPHDVLSHALLLEGVAAVGRVWISVHANAGVHATETAPVFVRTAPLPAAPALMFYERSFRPLQLSAAVTLPAAAHGTLRIEARHDRTAFYRSSGASLAIVRQHR